MKTGPAGSPRELIEALLIGQSTGIEALRREIAQVAKATIPVLIEGETGSGKELVAQALHMASGRPGAFVAVNVLAVAPSMFEAALFGHVRGAFTGAHADHDGYLVEANRGTLFLDELAGLDVTLQAKLLRAIETRALRPVGAKGEVRSDFRVIAATNVPGATLVERGDLRRDLVHRLAVCTLRVPSLRERAGDIPLLANRFLREVSDDPSRSFDEESLAALRQHSWPGNVRELRNVVEASALLSDTPRIRGNTVLAQISRLAITPADSPTRAGKRGVHAIRETLRVLDEAGGDVDVAAERLGVHRATIYRRVHKGRR